MKTKFPLFIFVLCFIMLLPNVAGASGLEDSTSSVELSSGSEGRAVSPEEFELISDTLVAEQEKDASITLEDVIEQLGLENVKVYYEDYFERKEQDYKRKEQDYKRNGQIYSNDFTIMAATNTYVGLVESDRDSTAYRVHPMLYNYKPFKVDRYQGRVEGFNKPAGNVGGGYIKQITKPFVLTNVPVGSTKVLDTQYMAHHGHDAKYTIEVTVTHGGLLLGSEFYRLTSTQNGGWDASPYPD